MLSEIDLNDWVMTDQPTKALFDVERNSVVSVPGYDNTVIYFYNLDGMYSYCRVLKDVVQDNIGKVVHLAAWTPVKVWVKADGK